MVAASTVDPERCTKLFVPSAARNAKFHSSQQKEDLFIAKNAS